jgi:L-lactate dehydrogenase complex protein LldG
VNRDAFLARIRSAVGVAVEPYSRPIVRVDRVPEVGYRLPSDDAVALFAERAGAVGTVVYRTEDPRSVVLDVIRGARTAITTAEDEVLALGDMPGTVGWQDVGVEGAKDADVAITGCVAAIAATGSVVLSSDTARGRAAGLLAPVHVVIVPAGRIVHSTRDVLLRVGGLGPPGLIAIETGPSRSADIEGQLVVGVHGPRDVHAVVVERA